MEINPEWGKEYHPRRQVPINVLELLIHPSNDDCRRYVLTAIQSSLCESLGMEFMDNPKFFRAANSFVMERLSLVNGSRANPLTVSFGYEFLEHSILRESSKRMEVEMSVKYVKFRLIFVNTFFAVNFERPVLSKL